VASSEYTRHSPLATRKLPMLYVNNNNITDPRINLAIEEHVLRNLTVKEPIVLFYVNDPSVIIGRNQNSIEEIDRDYVEANGINLVRRLSGGGAVYHDHGNLNFSFVTDGARDLHNFAKFNDPIVAALRELGVDAELRGKSDIFANGKKISGNAQYASKGRMFSHGTLLFDTNLEHLLKAINPSGAVIESKAVQSIRNFVTNIRELLPQDMTIEAFRQTLLDALFAGNVIEYELTAVDWEQIHTIAHDRFGSWDWNMGHAPKFDIQTSERLPIGKVDARVSVDGGYIQELKLYGDFSGTREVAELEAELHGVRYREEEIRERLQPINLADYFGALSPDEFLHLLSLK